MKYDFNKYKTEISLPDFLRDVLGWKHVEGSTFKNPKMQSPIDSQTIVIRKNPKGHYTYFDVHNDKIKGASILDLMQQHIFETTGKFPTLSEVGKMLQGYIDGGKTVLPKDSNYSLDNQLLDTNFVLKMIMNSKPVHANTKFFENRGFDLNVLNTSEWKDVFFEHEQPYQDPISKTTKVHNNICCRLSNVKGIAGISQRNEAFKGCMSQRYDALAYSNFDKSKAIDKLHIGESIFDMLAHYQMNYFNQGKNLNVLYVSSEGALTEGQIGTIQRIFRDYEVKSTELNFDNDKAGLLYALKYTGMTSGKNENVYFTANKGIQENDARVIYITAEVNEKNFDKAQDDLLRFFPEEIFTKYFDMNNVNVDLIEDKPEGFKFSFSFPYVKEVLQELTDNILNLKFDKEVQMKLPTDKDFNDDLKLKNIKEYGRSNITRTTGTTFGI